MRQRRYIASATSRRAAAASSPVALRHGLVGRVATPMSLVASLRYLQGDASAAGQTLVALLLGAAALASEEVDALRRVPCRRAGWGLREGGAGLLKCVTLLRAEAAALTDPTTRRLLDAVLLHLAREGGGTVDVRVPSGDRATVL